MNENELKDLALQKEKEWREIQEKRINVLETALKQKTVEFNDDKEKFQQLKEDFKYNLKLLEQRDKDLENFETTYSTLKKQVSEKNAEISELKIKIDELKKLLEKTQQTIDNDKKHYLSRLNQKQNEIEQYKAQKDAEINKERQEIEGIRRSLQLKINDLQYDLDMQRTELKTEFDECMRKREHEWRKQYDDQVTELMAKDLQIKLVNTELEQLKEANKALHSTNDEHETKLQQFERKIKEKEWECKDIESLKNAKIDELEEKIQTVEKKVKHQNEDLIRKFEDMDRVIRDKDVHINKLKDLIKDLEKEKNAYEARIDDFILQIKQNSSNANDQLRSKDEVIQSLNDSIVKLKLDIDSFSKNTVNADVRYSDLSQENEKMKKSISMYKTKLNEAAKREKIIEAEKAQLDMEWRKNFDSLKNLQFMNSEELVQNLTETNEKTIERVKQLEDQLKQKENFINVLKTTNPALEFLTPNTSDWDLKKENESLKAIIKSMRDEMVLLADNIPVKLTNNIDAVPNEQTPKNISVLSRPNKANEEFIGDLQNQVTKLKEKNRELQAQIDEFVVKQKLPDNITDNVILNNHMQSLNQTITSLRKDKVELTSLSKKQQTRLIFIEKSLNDSKEQLRLKQTQIETLQYELNSQTRRFTTEINSLKQKCTEFDLQLTEARREADEYHKMAIEKDSEISSLEMKISDLQLKLSTSGTELNFGAQELFIQQLQDEIERLNKKLQANSQIANSFYDGLTVESSYAKEIDDYKQKLKIASKHISQLLQDKHQLIEMSNQLKAEFNREKQKNDEHTLKRISDAERLNQNLQVFQQRQQHKIHESPLQKIEDMQYDLTRQKLALEQLKNLKTKNTVVDSVTSDHNTISTVRSENLNDLWKLLDESKNNSILNDESKRHIQANGVHVGFNKTKVVNNKMNSSVKKPNNPVRMKPRNYNIKDD